MRLNKRERGKIERALLDTFGHGVAVATAVGPDNCAVSIRRHGVTSAFDLRLLIETAMAIADKRSTSK